MAILYKVQASRPQAKIQGTRFHEWTLPDGSLWTEFYRSRCDYLLRFPDYADFEVSNDGLTVCCWPVDNNSPETIDHLYLNQVLPLALSKQGKLVFHAGAVEIEGGAVAFVGESGMGKSTLTASFATNGFRFLTDDGLVLKAEGETFNVQPSHPSIRLWDDSGDALLPPSAELAPSVSYSPKARFMAGNIIEFCHEPKRLRRVYFLENNGVDDVVVLPVPGLAALTELVKHSFLLDIEERDLLSSQLRDLSRLVPQINFFYLDYPRCYAGLEKVRQSILVHGSNS